MEGPISFHDFMEAALYDPQHGYYATLRGFGADGDFVTSPELHPVFGALLARQVLDLWEGLGRPEPFRLVELGGGSGALAEALLDCLGVEAAALAAALHYHLLERSPSLRALQQARLRGRTVAWERPVAPAHCLLANEVLDAFPVHRVVVRDGALRELRVGLAADGGFTWTEEPAPAAVDAYFDRLGLRPPEGAVAEVNLSLAAWAQEAASLLGSGLALVLDYGYPAEELYRRPMGTLLTYYRHTLGSDPLVRVGRQDISAHVDFTSLATATHQAGLDVLGVIGQRRLLQRLGFEQYAARQRSPADQAALAQLVDPQGLGRIGALYLGRGLGAYQPAGLADGRRWPEPRWVPSLPPGDDAFLDLWREAFGDRS